MDRNMPSSIRKTFVTGGTLWLAAAFAVAGGTATPTADELAKQAYEESLVPYHPADPQKTALRLPTRDDPDIKPFLEGLRPEWIEKELSGKYGPILSYMTYMNRRRKIDPKTGTYVGTWNHQWVRCIYPPSFDFQEVPGAARYRIGVGMAPVAGMGAPPVVQAPPWPVEMAEPLKGFVPGEGVTVTPLGDADWTFSRGLVMTPLQKYFTNCDPLIESGGATNFFPGVGSKVRVATVHINGADTGVVECEFKPMNQTWVQDEGLIDMTAVSEVAVGPAKSNDCQSLCLYGVISTDNTRVVRISLDGARCVFFMWMNGQPVYNEQAVRLGKGYYPVTLALKGNNRHGPPSAVKVRLLASDDAGFEAVAKKRRDWEDSRKPIASFEADKPWRPLTPIWAQLPPTEVGRGIGKYYEVHVTALDAQGKDLGPAKTISTYERDPELEYFHFLKGPPFSIPVKNPPTAEVCRMTAERVVRWRFLPYSHIQIGPIWQNHDFTPEKARTMLSEAGDNLMHETAMATGGHGCYVMLSILPPGSPDRQEWMEYAKKTRWMLDVKNRSGLYSFYQGHVVMVYMAGDAALDLYAVTKDPAYLEYAVSLAKAMANVQQPDGTWIETSAGAGETAKEPRIRKSWGSLWSHDNITRGEFNPSEMLCFYGRLRVEGANKDFEEAEKKAYEWVTNNSMQTMFWLAQGLHSYSVNDDFKALVAPRSALYFVRYLQEYAPAERRDMAVVDKLFRYIEDQYVYWVQAKPESKELSMYGDSRDDLDNRICMAMLARSYLKAHIETGNALYKAKADALLTATLERLKGMDPAKSGVERDAFGYIQAQTARYILEYGRLLEKSSAASR